MFQFFLIEKEPDNYLNLRGNENRNLQSKISLINDEELQELNNAFDKKTCLVPFLVPAVVWLLQKAIFWFICKESQILLPISEFPLRERVKTKKNSISSSKLSKEYAYGNV